MSKICHAHCPGGGLGPVLAALAAVGVAGYFAVQLVASVISIILAVAVALAVAGTAYLVRTLVRDAGTSWRPALAQDRTAVTAAAPKLRAAGPAEIAPRRVLHETVIGMDVIEEHRASSAPQATAWQEARPVTAARPEDNRHA